MVDNDKYSATLAGIDLSIQDISDALCKALIRHEFPDRDGALVEDMGQKARTIRFRAFFINDDYDNHQSVIDLLEVRDSYELVHPKYGVIVGYIENLDLRHDDRAQYAELDISFVEDLIGSTDIVMVDVPDVQSACEQSFLSGIANQLSALSRDISKDMQAITNAVDLQGYTVQLNACVSAATGIFSTITNPANSILATVQFATDIPGQVLGALAYTVERYSIMFDALKSAPSRFVTSFRNGMIQLRASFGSGLSASRQAAINTVVKHATISGALQLGLDLADCYKTDEAARQDQKKMETAKSFDAAGNYLNPELPDPAMTINEIEQSLADARTEIESAVVQARDLRDLQDMAESLLAHVNQTKLERERVMNVTIQNALPLHLICLKYGLSYQSAERVHAINRFPNPNVVNGDIKIYVQ